MSEFPKCPKCGDARILKYILNRSYAVCPTCKGRKISSFTRMLTSVYILIIFTISVFIANNAHIKSRTDDVIKKHNEEVVSRPFKPLMDDREFKNCRDLIATAVREQFIYDIGVYYEHVSATVYKGYNGTPQSVKKTFLSCLNEIYSREAGKCMDVYIIIDGNIVPTSNYACRKRSD